MSFLQDPNNQQRSAAAGIVAASSASGAAPPPPAAASAARPKSVSQWSVVDVQKWFRKSCGEYYSDYAEKLLEQDITGRQRVELRLNPNRIRIRIESASEIH